MSQEPYDPQVDDYVVWERDIHGKRETDEGWVYFKGDPVEPKKGVANSGKVYHN